MRTHEILLYVVCKITDILYWNVDYYNTADYVYEQLYRVSCNGKTEYLSMISFLIYKLIPRDYYKMIEILYDLLVYMYFGEPLYLVVAVLQTSLPIKLRSIFLCFYSSTEYPLPLEACLCIDPYYITLSNNSFCEKLTAFFSYYDLFNSKLSIMILPCTNVFWFYYLNMFSQYKDLMHKIIIVSYLYLSTLSQSRLDNIFLTLIFNNTSYMEYYTFYKLRRCKSSSVFVASCCLFVVLERYVMWMFKNTGSGNLNFVNWFTMFFVLVNVFDYNLVHLQK